MPIQDLSLNSAFLLSFQVMELTIGGCILI
jgi:hypothetical protein